MRVQQSTAIPDTQINRDDRTRGTDRSGKSCPVTSISSPTTPGGVPTGSNVGGLLVRLLRCSVSARASLPGIYTPNCH